MTSRLDLVAAGWVLIVLGGLVSAIALVALLSATVSLLRPGWSPMLGGIGFVLQGIELVRRASWENPESFWQWAGVVFMAAAVGIALSQRVRHKRAGQSWKPQLRGDRSQPKGGTR